jgi:hypothetical protein
VVVQFTDRGATPPIVGSERVQQPKFDGRWLWTDDAGREQPQVTLFDGLFRAENPNLPKLDVAYKALALKMRDAQCDTCHVSNNPDKMKRLVLLQTPAHAAGEIERLMKAVREDKTLDRVDIKASRSGRGERRIARAAARSKRRCARQKTGNRRIRLHEHEANCLRSCSGIRSGLAKGRTVALPVLDPGPYAFRASMAYVGLNPRKDSNRSAIRLLGGVVCTSQPFHGAYRDRSASPRGV